MKLTSILLASGCFFVLPAVVSAQTGTQVILGGPASTCRLTMCKAEITFSPSGEEQAICKQMVGTCSGTLISPTQVLTAAHCVSGMEDRTRRVLVQCGYTGYDPKTSPAALPPPPPDSDEEQSDPHEDIGINFSSAQFAQQIRVLRVERNPGFKDHEEKQKPSSRGGNIFRIAPQCIRDLDQQDRAEEAAETKRKKTAKATEAGPGVDIALLTLRTPADPEKVKPVAVGDAARYFDANGVRAGVECVMSGFGLGSAGKSGLLKTGPVSGDFGADLEEGNIGQTTNFSISTARGIARDVMAYLTYNALSMGPNELSDVIIYLANKGLFKTQMLPGASGGPLYCRVSRTQPWEVVGVNDAISLRAECAREKVDSSIEMRLRLYNYWGIPNLSKITQTVADYGKPAAVAAK